MKTLGMGVEILPLRKGAETSPEGGTRRTKFTAFLLCGSRSPVLQPETGFGKLLNPACDENEHLTKQSKPQARGRVPLFPLCAFRPDLLQHVIPTSLQIPDGLLQITDLRETLLRKQRL